MYVRILWQTRGNK